MLLSFSCEKKQDLTGSDPTKSTFEVANGKQIFTRKCTPCHGENGRKMMYGAKDLSITTLSIFDKIQVLSHGRGAMPNFSYELNPAEIRAVARYTEELKAKEVNVY